MAADYQQMMQNLRQFYDFSGKTVLAVGAGGGQFIDLGRGTRKLIAIDKDDAAIRQLQTKITSEALQDQVDIVQADFCETSLCGDVVYFEFSLHEMDDPEKALQHATTLAPYILIFDHLPDSEWAFYVAEEEKVRRSRDALRYFSCTRHRSFHAEQRFKDHAQLLEKVSCQGPLAVERAERYVGINDIVIPMTYGLTLLQGHKGLSAANPQRSDALQTIRL